MSGAIVDLSKGSAPADVTVDICIIGSGPGGSTAARVLAEAGREVLVLEEGPDRTGGQMTQRELEMYDQLYMDRGGRSTDDLAISVLQGRALGGGSVINVSDVVPIPDGVLDHWQRNHGLSHWTKKDLASHQARALKDLAAAPIPDRLISGGNRVLEAGTRKLGLAGENMHHNRVDCVGFGTCLIGCPVDAKRNARKVAIPAAVAAGARFLVRARALRIEDGNKEIKRIVARVLDERGYHERVGFEVRARTVILAAGAVGSPQLLLRSGLGNEHVGRHLMLQPQLPLTAMFDRRIDAFKGIPQSWAVTEYERADHPEHGLWGFRIEGIMGTPGITSSLLPTLGAPGKSLMTRYNKMAGALLLVPDAPSGRVQLHGDGRPKITYEQTDEHKERVREAIRVAARVYLAAGATRVLVPTAPGLEIANEADISQVDDLDLRPATAPLISAHQQGTLRMSPDVATGAVDPEGRLRGARGVWVVDSSVYPSSSSSHTMTPIMTTSSWLAAVLVEKSG